MKALTVFSDQQSFEIAHKMADALAHSALVPKEYQGNIPNCLLALDMAQRLGLNPAMVMQNLYLVHGRPSWSAQFVISAINSCGRFTPLRYVLTGEGAERSCYAWALDAQGERLEGPPVTIAMAKAEGWATKNGSKWQTMPELMIRYRAATFFGRLYAPELLMGLSTADESEDIAPQVVHVAPEAREQARIAALAQLAAPAPMSDAEKAAALEQERREAKGGR